MNIDNASQPDGKERALLKAVDSLADGMFDLAARLVAEPSVLGQEASAVRVMEDEFVRLGFDPIRVPIDPGRLQDHPGFAPVPWEYVEGDQRNNLVVVVPGHAGSGRGALFNGHLDVVSPEPREQWEHDPFTPQVRDGWLHGRGAGDMKAGVAAMVHAAHAVTAAGFALGGDLTLETVIEEECCGNGALACLDAGYDADAVLIPEPFGPTILTSQPGVLWFRIDIRGRAGHVLDTRAGANAVEKLFPLIDSLRALEEEMNNEPRPAAYASLDHPLNLNVGIVRGGDWPSTVPAFAELHGRLSFFPGVSYESVCERIVDTVRAAAVRDHWLSLNPPKVSFYAFRSEGHSLGLDLEPFQVLSGCHQALTGEPPREYVCTCTTDLRAFASFGRGQGTCYGPVAENIHAPNERVLLESVLHTARAYALFLARWCGLVD